MTHTPETLKAATEYAMDYRSDYVGHVRVAFLVGYDYRQKEIDELVRKLKESTEIIKAFNFRHTQIEVNDKLIQKHKR